MLYLSFTSNLGYSEMIPEHSVFVEASLEQHGQGHIPQQ